MSKCDCNDNRKIRIVSGNDLTVEALVSIYDEDKGYYTSFDLSGASDVKMRIVGAYSKVEGENVTVSGSKAKALFKAGRYGAGNYGVEITFTRGQESFRVFERGLFSVVRDSGEASLGTLAEGGSGEGMNISVDVRSRTLRVGQVSGITDYNLLENRPSIGGVTLEGNKRPSDLGMYSKEEADGKFETKESAAEADKRIQEMLDGKVDKEPGKGLSANDLTDERAGKVDMLAKDGRANEHLNGAGTYSRPVRQGYGVSLSEDNTVSVDPQVIARQSDVANVATDLAAQKAKEQGDIDRANAAISKEETDRKAAVAALQSLIDILNSEYQFCGIATPEMAPGTPDQNVAYLAGPGTYPNFSALVVPENLLGVLKYNGTWTLETIDFGLSAINRAINGGQNIFNGSIPVVQGKVNQRSSGAKCAINIPAGRYIVNMDASFFGSLVYVYYHTGSQNLFLGSLADINGKTVTLELNAVEINIYVTATNSLKTGDCAFTFSEAEPEIGLVDEIKQIKQTVASYDAKLDGSNKNTDVSFELTTALQSAAATKKDVTILPGKYWVDVSPMSLLKTSLVYVYAYYEDAPNTPVKIGDLSSFMTEYWQTSSANFLLEIELAKKVVAMSIYHVANAVNAGTITLSFVDQDAVLSLSDQIDRIAQKNNPAFVGYRTTGTIAVNGVLTLPKIHVTKDSALSVEINGNAENVQFGIGYNPNTNNKRGYTGYWCKLTSTTIEFYYSNNNTVLLQTLEHGLTLDDKTKITIRVSNGVAKRDIRIVTKLGQEYKNTTNINFFGVGAPFIENSGSGEITGKISFIPNRLSAKVWVFGDSYCGVNDAARWMTQILGMGINGFLLNARGGEAMKEAVQDLTNILKCGYIPKYIVWALGMNGGGDSSVDVPADYQKLWLMRFLRICKQNGITPILCTIPSVQANLHDGLNAYIKTLGYRYIDLAEAVGATSAGIWYDGLMSSDNVHPSEQGARVLAQRVLLDFPEIQNI